MDCIRLLKVILVNRRSILTRALFLCSMLALILNPFDLTAQTTSDESEFYKGELSKAINLPVTPEAEAFTKYGDVEVSMYSGIPQIAVPIHTYQGREMELGISLSYDASGIKVEDQASYVGLGWNLAVGGRITRITNGLPDDFITTG